MEEWTGFCSQLTGCPHWSPGYLLSGEKKKRQIFGLSVFCDSFFKAIWRRYLETRFHEHYLGQLVPELIQIAEDLGMNSRAPDVVNIPQNSQSPPPEYKGRISMPASQTAPGNDADVISQELTAVCKQNRSNNTSQQTAWFISRDFSSTPK